MISSCTTLRLITKSTTLKSLHLFVISGIKDFSNWPTIPQVFINGEFVGGCDILLQMHQSGDLIEELRKAGISSALLDAASKDTSKDSGKSDPK